MPGLTHLVMYVTPDMCEPSSLTAAQKSAARLTLNDPRGAESDNEPVLLLSQVHRKVFLNVTLGALSGQADTAQGCSSVLQFKNFPEAVRMMTLFCAQNELSKARRPDPDLLILLMDDLCIPKEFGPHVCRRFLESILRWIESNMTPEKNPQMLAFVDGKKMSWKIHTRYWTSETTTAQIAEEVSEHARSLKPALVDCGLKVLMDRVIAQLAGTRVWDSPCPLVRPVPRPRSQAPTPPPSPRSQAPTPPPTRPVPPPPFSQAPTPPPGDRSASPAPNNRPPPTVLEALNRELKDVTRNILSARRDIDTSSGDLNHLRGLLAANTTTLDKLRGEMETKNTAVDEALNEIRGGVDTSTGDLQHLRGNVVANTTTLSDLRGEMGVFNKDLKYLYRDVREATKVGNSLAYIIDGKDPEGTPIKSSVMSRLLRLELERGGDGVSRLGQTKDFYPLA